MNRACVLLILVCAICFVPTSQAQVQTGTPPFGTFGGGPETIDLANLNSHIVIPVINKQGRGLNFTYNFTYDTSVWQTVPSGSQKAWVPLQSAQNNWGWQGTNALSPSEIVESSLTPHLCFANGILGGQTGQVNFYGWTYLDALGTGHGFGTTDVVTGNCPGFSTSSINSTASDGSGYTLAASGQSFISLKDRYGNSLFPPINSQTQSSGPLIQDPNGNQISFNGSAYIDTLGTTVLSTSGTAPNPVAFTYTAPSGAAASYTVRYASYTVQTAFGCSGILEFGPTTENLVSEIDLPDDNPNGVRDRYTFTYEVTPNDTHNPHYVTGRLASVTTPTGGIISYSYSGGSHGITCADGSTATLTRATPDGTWTYAHSESGTAWTTTVTDPTAQQNQTVYSFQTIYQTERKVYNGSSSSGTLLEDDVACYNGNTTNCNNTAVALPITEIIVTKALGTQVCKHVYSYNSFGLLTEQDDYDYGNGAPATSPLRKELITYASLGNNIADTPSQVLIENGSGTIVAKTNIIYDGASVFAPPGTTPQHVSVSGSRGNPTSIYYLVAGSTELNKSFTYYDTGNVQTSTDVNSASTTYEYPDATSTCGNAFPTKIDEPLSLTRSMTWNCAGGVQISATDENGQITSTAWADPYFWRPASSTDEAGNLTNLTYPSLTSVESSLVFNGGSSAVDILKTLDGLGRVQLTQKRVAPNSGNFDSVESDYDNIGRTCRGTVPYVGTPGQQDGTPTCTESSGPATTQTYDALNRPLITTDSASGTITLTYAGNDVLQSIGPAPTGENPKQKRFEYNSIGQLMSVCEITAGTPAAPAGTCGQTTSATGYWTQYTYDVLGDLLTVKQNAQSSTNSQTRTYTYDDLGRMTSEKNPETGATAITYVYDSDSAGTCSGRYNGDLVKKTDAGGNVSCFAYDALHRVTGITYPSGPNSANTPAKHFVYDSATLNSVAMANANTHLAEAYTCTSTCTTKLTDEGFSYTVRGEVTDVYESTPHSGGYFHVAETYLANGALTSENNNLSGVPAITLGVDGEGRLTTVSAGSQTLATNTSYNVASEVTAVTFGSGDSDSFQFDTNTFRMTQYKYTVGTTPKTVVGNLNWNANGTLGSLGITDAFNAANTQSCTYSYDDLARIASGNCGSSVWSQTFSYDAFGNLTKAGSESFNPGYTLNNQMMTGATYDATGDVLSDSLHSYAWNSDTRPTTIDAMTVTYDALGRMVEQSKSGTNVEIVYDCLGNKLALMNGISAQVKSFIPLPGGATAVYAPGGLQYYRHGDWLGSSRFSSTPTTRTMYNDLAFAPFGETYATAGSTGVTDISFAGNNEDTTTNLYDAQFREYGRQGRWPSPDPAGISAANPSNPQSWNRYAYVFNNPILFSDPTGFEPPGNNTSSLTCQQIAAGQVPNLGFGSWLKGAAGVQSMFDTWFGGVGPTNIVFGPTSVPSQQMLSAPGMAKNVQAFLAGTATSGHTDFGVRGLISAGVNATAQFVGSYEWSMSLSGGSLNIKVTNSTTMWSFFLHAPVFNPNPPTRTGWVPMGRVNQEFDLTVPCTQPQAKPPAPSSGSGAGGSGGVDFGGLWLLQWIGSGTESCNMFTGPDDWGGKSNTHPCLTQ